MIAEAENSIALGPPQLRELEEKVNDLIKKRDQLRMVNNSLREKLSRTTLERAVLTDKNKKATMMLKRTITRMKKELPELN